MSFDADANRRRFLAYTRCWPRCSPDGAGSALAETLLPQAQVARSADVGCRSIAADLIKSPKDATNVFDFEPVCRQNVPPSHLGYMAAGIDDEVTLRANRQDFQKFRSEPRSPGGRQQGSTIKTDILGVTYDSLIIICPIGGQRLVPRGRREWHRQGGEGRQPFADSLHRQPPTRSRTSPPRRGQPIWQQLYATNKWEICRGDHQTRRERRLPRGRGDGRPLGRLHEGRALPPAPQRHARLLKLPRQQQRVRRATAPGRCTTRST